MQPYYFGCYERKGHFLHERQGNSLWHVARNSGPKGFTVADLDQGFCPAGHQVQGVAKLSYAHGYTVLAFWDRSVDMRQGSHSTFLIPGELAFDCALEAAKTAFPMIFERFQFSVIPSPTDKGGEGR